MKMTHTTDEAIDSALFEFGAIAAWRDDDTVVRWRQTSGHISNRNSQPYDSARDLVEAINDGSLSKPKQSLVD